MADTKDELVGLIKEWVALENEIKLLNKEVKERRERKKKITSSLVDVMKNNEIDCFDISDGKLLYTRNQVKAPLSKKHLCNSICEYLAKINIDSEEAAKIVKHVMESRQVSTKEGVRLKSTTS